MPTGIPSDFNKEIKKLKRVRSNRELYCPPILDMDPTFAAYFMTKEDSEEALKALLYCFKVLTGEKKSKYPLLESAIKRGYANFYWFCVLTKTLRELIDEKEFEVPEGIEPKQKPDDYFYVLPPMEYKYKKIREVKFPSFLTNTIDKNRYLYIKKQVQLEDFRDGYPAWYCFSSMTLFEKYNVMTNVRVRIDFSNGEFRYYLSGASDDWKEIKDVPLEMDHVISALMFRS